MQETLNDALARAMRTWPAKTFLRIDGAEVSFEAFDRDVGRLAAGLRSAGVRRGDHVVVFMRNSLACLHTWFATNRLGAVWAPVNTELRGLTLVHVCELASASVFIADEELVEPLRRALGDRGLHPRLIVHGAGDDRLDDVYADEPIAPEPVTFGDSAALLFTSGTTGRSKACVLSHRYFIEQASILVRDFELRHDDVLYCPFPLFHADATALTTVPALLLGATAAISRRFSASRFWDEVREHGATVFDFMGATLAILHKAEPRPDDADNPIRLAWGVPVPEWVEDFERRFNLRVVELYGSVEASIPVTQPLHEPRVPGSCGRVTDGFELRIHDEHDEPVATGVTGELVVRPMRSATILDGYFGMPDATVEAFRNLWFHTGDLGRVDDAGNVFFAGRRKEAIRRRGENISAFEVEEGVLLHPDVLECAAIGVPSELTEEEVKVCVVVRPGSPVMPEDIIRHCEATLAGFQVPRYVEIVAELPKTPTGKLEKYRLLERALTPGTWDREALAERPPSAAAPT
ncbi:MAG: carnitine-CoA ligase [Solirubrobacteraceae bacterium]